MLGKLSPRWRGDECEQMEFPLYAAWNHNKKEEATNGRAVRG